MAEEVVRLVEVLVGALHVLHVVHKLNVLRLEYLALGSLAAIVQLVDVRRRLFEVLLHQVLELHVQVVANRVHKHQDLLHLLVHLIELVSVE